MGHKEAWNMADIQESAQSESAQRRRRRRVWAVVGIPVGAFIAYLFIYAAINPKPDPISLSAKVRIIGQLLVVYNDDDAYWTPVHFTINNEYRYTHDMLAATGEIDIPLHDFVTDEGVRFNPQTHQILNLSIVALDASYEDGKQVGSWYYSRDGINDGFIDDLYAWYEGGTLHEVDGDTWLWAPRIDKLATAADWAATWGWIKAGNEEPLTAAQFISMMLIAEGKGGEAHALRILLQGATDLVACLDTAYSPDGEGAPLSNVVAGRCLKMMDP